MKRCRLIAIVLLALTSLAIALDPPPFGTVMGQWSLTMGGTGVGAGVAWCRDSGLIYLLDQGHSGSINVWKLDTADPSGTIRRDSWAYVDLGSSTLDIPYCIAWDPDSGCFWMSQVVDGDQSQGSYLLRMAWSDGAWRWRGTPADSWGRFDTVACWDMAKRPEGDYFVGAKNGGSSLYKFDPYTKTLLGDIDSLASARCVALVPADSYYIISEDSSPVMLDSAGQLLKRGTRQLGLAGVDLVIPKLPYPDDPVCAYGAVGSSGSNILMKISTGLAWGQFPSYVRSGMSCVDILAPAGTVDSGELVIPAFVVRVIEPASGVSAGYRIDFAGGGSVEESLTGLSSPGAVTETLEFSGFVATARDSMNATFWVRCPGDTIAEDDTIRNRSFMRVSDIAIPWVRADKDTFEQGEEVTVKARIENRGNVSLTFDVNTLLGDSSSTRSQTLAAGDSAVVSYGAGQMPPGIYFTGARAVVPGDLVPGNNGAGDTLVVRGDIDYDYAVIRILEPTGIKDTLTPVAPSATIKNQGATSGIAQVFFRITGPDDSVIMFDSTHFMMLAPGDSSAEIYPEIRFTKLGQYVAACSVRATGDQNCLNDRIVDTFEVAEVGVTEAPGTPMSYGLSPIPNPVSGSIMLQYALPPGAAALRVYDVTGRAVIYRNLAGGRAGTALNLRHLSAGVYVLRLDAGTFTCSEKMILQR
jgi:hypothetical protein